MRGVLCLFEGVVAGAADGYARMTGKPAATLLHLGPGFANAISFLHNARKGHQPMVNIVGDHATSHAQICPGAADLRHHGDLRFGVGLAASMQVRARGGRRWRARGSGGPRRAGKDRHPGAAGRYRLERGGRAGAALPVAAPGKVDSAVIDRIAAALKNGKRTALLLWGTCLQTAGVQAAGRIAQQDRRAAAARLFHPAPDPRRRSDRSRAHSLFRRRDCRISQGPGADRAGGRGPAGDVLCLSRQAQLGDAGRLRTADPGGAV